ncbi:TolC family protein [Marivirga sp. S37H4]|uniref:TolC family protein n=1 Tax=Marivirga aurantiaca TaxID=2802615 RepID=A0A934X1V1_9BACT|nr:TolC family protein [Marivirga aurantiaca]MBK6267389.1 TolC family protein [Marivirga aurantiaca]
MFKFLWVAISLLLAVSGLKAQEVRKISFREAVKIASESNIQLKRERNQLVSLEAEKLQSKMAFLPSASLNMRTARQDGQQFQLVEDGFEIKNVQSTRLSGGLNASLNLFDGFSRVHNRKVIEHNYAAQVKGVERTKQEIIFQTAQQYLQILLDQELLKINERAIENQEQLLQQIEGFVKEGIRAKADLFTQQAELRRFELAAIESENQLEIDKATFAQILQLDPFEKFEVIAVENISSIQFNKNDGLASLFEIAVANRSDLQQMELRLSSSRRNIASSKSSYYPSLSAFYEYGTQYSTLNSLSFQEQFFELYPSNTIGLNLSIPLFNNYTNKTRVEVAKVQLSNSALDLEDIKRNIFLEIQNAYLNYEASLKRIEVTKAGLHASQEAYEVQNQRYQMGASSLIELSQANQILVQAESDYAQARFTLAFQKLIVEYNIGTLKLDDIN